MAVWENSKLKLSVVPFILHFLVTIAARADYKSKRGDIPSPEAIQDYNFCYE
jgi:hypothetical protein